MKEGWRSCTWLSPFLEERRVEVVLMVLEFMSSSSCLQHGQHTLRHRRTTPQLLKIIQNEESLRAESSIKGRKFAYLSCFTRLEGRTICINILTKLGDFHTEVPTLQIFGCDCLNSWMPISMVRQFRNSEFVYKACFPSPPSQQPRRQVVIPPLQRVRAIAKP